MSNALQKKIMPLLQPEDIQVRIQQIFGNEEKATAYYLLYKNARVDMDILDRFFGAENWQRHHHEIKGNLFCTIAVKNDQGEWVEKEDVGIESEAQAEKGEASDAFKRAGVNWGIGRELYTSPKIKVEYSKSDLYINSKKKLSTYVTLHVKDIAYSNDVVNEDTGETRRKITGLTLVDQHEKVRFAWGLNSQNYGTPPQSTPHEQTSKPTPKTASKSKYVEIDGKSCKVLTKEGMVDVNNLTVEQLGKLYDNKLYKDAKPFINAILDKN